MGSEHAELEIVLRWRPHDDAFDVGLAWDDPSDPQDRRDYVDDPLRIDTLALRWRTYRATTCGTRWCRTTRTGWNAAGSARTWSPPWPASR